MEEPEEVNLQPARGCSARTSQRAVFFPTLSIMTLSAKVEPSKRDQGWNQSSHFLGDAEANPGHCRTFSKCFASLFQSFRSYVSILQSFHFANNNMGTN